MAEDLQKLTFAEEYVVVEMCFCWWLLSSMRIEDSPLRFSHYQDKILVVNRFAIN